MQNLYLRQFQMLPGACSGWSIWRWQCCPLPCTGRLPWKLKAKLDSTNSVESSLPPLFMATVVFTMFTHTMFWSMNLIALCYIHNGLIIISVGKTCRCETKKKDKIKKWKLKKLSLMILFHIMNVFTKDQWCGSSQTNIWLSPCSDSGISSYLSKVSARRNLLLLILGAKHPLQIAFSVLNTTSAGRPPVHQSVSSSSESFFEGHNKQKVR